MLTNRSLTFRMTDRTRKGSSDPHTSQGSTDKHTSQGSSVPHTSLCSNDPNFSRCWWVMWRHPVEPFYSLCPLNDQHKIETAFYLGLQHPLYLVWMDLTGALWEGKSQLPALTTIHRNKIHDDFIRQYFIFFILCNLERIVILTILFRWSYSARSRLPSSARSRPPSPKHAQFVYSKTFLDSKWLEIYAYQDILPKHAMKIYQQN